MEEIQPLEATLTATELLAQIDATAAHLRTMIKDNPELATVRIIDFNPSTTVLKSVREAVWTLFDASAKFIRRNSTEALKADIKLAILNVAPALQAYDENIHGNIQSWIQTEVQEKIDPDLRPSALIMESYRIPATGTVKKMINRAYTAMATYRRSRSGNKMQPVIQA